MSRDRVTDRPKSLNGLLRWATKQYGLEPPPRLHDRDIADDGAPDHTPQAAYYLGLDGPCRCPNCSSGKRDVTEELPDNWLRITGKLDEDGFYRTPMRHALEQVRDPHRRALLKGLLTNTFFPSDVARLHDLPDWAAGDVIHRSLDMLWNIYSDRPIPQRSRKSEAQIDAETAA